MSAPRILLVDNQQEVNQMLRASLEHSGRGYIVVDVSSGEDALRELGRGPVDLLVSDLRLSEISGLELLSIVRQLNPDARGILLSGRLSENVKAQAEEIGGVDFLPKPVETSFFIEAVERALKLTGVVGSPVQVREDEKPRLIEILESVRLELGAEATLLLDEDGEVVVQTGNLTVDLEVARPSILAAFQAGLKTSALLGSLLPGNLQYFDGDTHDLYLTNVGALFVLLIIFRSGQETGKMGAVVHFGRKAAGKLVDELSNMGRERMADSASGSVSQTKGGSKEEAKLSVVEVDESSHNIDFGTSDQDVDGKDAEIYWDKAVDESPIWNEVEGEMLTYKEARDKGLLEEDDEEGA